MSAWLELQSVASKYIPFRAVSADFWSRGWSGPEDPYILRGSCGLTYSLVSSDPALERGDYFPTSSNESGKPSKPFQARGKCRKGAPTWFLFILGAGVLYIIYKIITGPRDDHPPGFHDDPRDDGPPPPPYDPRPPKMPFQDPAPNNRFGGFWTGLAAGAGATMLGNSLRNRGATNEPQSRRRVVQGNRLERDWARGEGGSSSMRTSTGCARSLRLRPKLSLQADSEAPRIGSPYGGRAAMQFITVVEA
jgi:hypothetical protein